MKTKTLHFEHLIEFFLWIFFIVSHLMVSGDSLGAHYNTLLSTFLLVGFYLASGIAVLNGLKWKNILKGKESILMDSKNLLMGFLGGMALAFTISAIHQKVLNSLGTTLTLWIAILISVLILIATGRVIKNNKGIMMKNLLWRLVPIMISSFFLLIMH